MTVTPIPGEIARLRIRRAGIPKGTETLVVQTQDEGLFSNPVEYALSRPASAYRACGIGSKRLFGRADQSSRPSAVEHRPAELVAQPLIFQDEVANRIRELFALPPALEPAGALTLADGGGRTRGLDRVGRSTELVCGDMRHRCRLAGSICGVPSGSAQRSCRSH